MSYDIGEKNNVAYVLTQMTDQAQMIMQDGKTASALA